MSTTLKAIGLIRLSTQEQAQEGRAGIDRQKNDIAVAARVHGLTVTRVVEVIESGTKVRGQADFQQIFRELKSGVVDGVVCSNLDRLVRPDCFEDFAVFDHFRANHKLIWTPGEVVDPSTQNGFLVSGFRGLLAGLERQLIVTRTTAGKEELRKQGRHPNGAQCLPRGIRFDKQTRQWSYDGIDSERVRRAFQLVLEGRSYRAIAAIIGAGWSGKGIRDAMRNSIWHGIRTFPPTADRKMPLERRVISEGEALISRAMWDRVQGIIGGRKDDWGARLREPRFLAASMLACSCGKPYYTKANSRGSHSHDQEHYICCSRYRAYGPPCGARSLQRPGVDQAVVSIVKDTFRDPALLLRLVELSGQRTEAVTDTTKLQAQLDRLESKRQRFIDAYGEGDITKAEFQKRLDGVEADKRSIEAMLPTTAPALDARRLVKALVKYFAGFEHRPFGEQRQILRAAFGQFVVENGAIPAATLNGGFLGSMEGAKVSPRSRWPYSPRCRDR